MKTDSLSKTAFCLAVFAASVMMFSSPSRAEIFRDYFNYADTPALTGVWTKTVLAGGANFLKTPGKNEANITFAPFFLPGYFYGTGSVSIPNNYGDIAVSIMKATIGVTYNSAILDNIFVRFFIKDINGITYKSTAANSFLDLSVVPSGDKFTMALKHPNTADWVETGGGAAVPDLNKVTNAGLYFEALWHNSGGPLPSAQIDIDFFALTPEPETYLMIFLALLFLIFLAPEKNPGPIGELAGEKPGAAAIDFQS